MKTSSKVILKRLYLLNRSFPNHGYYMENASFFVLFSTSPISRWSNVFDFSLIFREMATWPTPVNIRISKITLKHALLDFIHTCESWCSYLTRAFWKVYAQGTWYAPDHCFNNLRAIVVKFGILTLRDTLYQKGWIIFQNGGNFCWYQHLYFMTSSNY